MLFKRIVPSLCLHYDKLIHRTKFNINSDRYVGDPLNAISVFNQYHVDEIILIDLFNTKENKEINFPLLKEISEEAFFPLTYGGGIKKIKDANKIITLGFEKILINQSKIVDVVFLNNLSKEIGAQSIVVSLNVYKNNDNYYLYDHLSGEIFSNNILDVINVLNSTSAFGELLFTLVNIDGTMNGCDLNFIKKFENESSVPLIYKGGVSSEDDIKAVLKSNFNAVSSSSYFIMKKPNSGIVLNYPSDSFKETVC